MAFEELYGLDAAKAHLWTGRNVTDDHLAAAEEELASIEWLALDVRDTALLAEHERRPIARAVAFLAAALYDAEHLDGEVVADGAGQLAVKAVTAGDVRVELAQGASGVLVDGQLSGRVDWTAQARRVLAQAGLLAHRLNGHSRGQAFRPRSTIVNDI